MALFKKDPETSPVDLSALAQPAPEIQPRKIAAPPAALTPEMQAFMNTSISATVKEIFASMLPLLASIALTPEKIAQMEELRRAPTASQTALIARNAREKKLMVEEQEQNRANLLRNQAACPHRYPTGQNAINIVRNFPDRQVRGTCPLCQTWLHPREWQVGPPDAENPRGTPFIAEAHPQYHLVAEAMAIRG